jgi:hypothetical protein
MTRLKLWIVLAALGAASFGAASLTQAKGRKKTGKTAVATADCKTDRDCVAVPDDCCPCSQGGKQHAIPKKEQAAYEKDRKKRCAGTTCTEQMSTDPSCAQKPFCGAGICELGDSGGADAPAAP